MYKEKETSQDFQLRGHTSWAPEICTSQNTCALSSVLLMHWCGFTWIVAFRITLTTLKSISPNILKNIEH